MGVHWELAPDPHDEDRCIMRLEFPDGNPAAFPITFSMGSQEADELGDVLKDFALGADEEREGDIA